MDPNSSCDSTGTTLTKVDVSLSLILCYTHSRRTNSDESRTPPGHPSNRRKGKAITGFDKLIAENVILIVSTSECCMCASVKSLLVSLGVNPVIFKVDEEDKTSVLIKLIKMNEVASSDTREPWELPTVYIKGKDLEGVDKVMESHLKYPVSYVVILNVKVMNKIKLLKQ
ncbi:glutaredoxin-C8-like [Capsicum annuum]|uniref:glutaredoxin-C8-like n=1 Tax=Capsicum annuum TaxID=4072 RepID=UPI001FB1737A|nr:glutaredoxin-C8-like [Capsicum annuum]